MIRNNPKNKIINLASSQDILNLSSIVLYNHHQKARILNTNLQLLKDDDIVYSKTIKTSADYYRIDGPKIGEITEVTGEYDASNILAITGNSDALGSYLSNLNEIIDVSLNVGDDIMVAVGSNGYTMRCEGEENKWSLNIDPDRSAFKSVAYGEKDKIFVAISSDGVKWSKDGAHW